MSRAAAHCDNANQTIKPVLAIRIDGLPADEFVKWYLGRHLNSAVRI
jgi:hypothetical protein